MKICRIVSQLDFGGVEQRLRLTANFFSSHPQHELIILVLGNGGRICCEIERLHFKVKVLNENVKIPNFILVYKIFKFLKFHKPDVIHASGAEANFHGLLAGFLIHAPVRIGEEIGFPNHEFYFKFLFRGIYFLSHHVIAISNAVSNRLIELKEVVDDKITVIYNPVSFVNIDPAFILKDSNNIVLLKANAKNVFVTICRLVPIKNLELLIQVFNNFLKIPGNQNSLLWIIGDGPEKKKLIELTESHEISEKVIFFGFIKNVVPFLQNSDAFILPSQSEGFSIALVEAMLCGLPVISTKVGGPSEIITHKKNGFLFDPKNESELLNLMTKVSSMPANEKNALIKSAIKRGSEFSINNYGINLMKLYNRLGAIRFYKR